MYSSGTTGRHAMNTMMKSCSMFQTIDWRQLRRDKISSVSLLLHFADTSVWMLGVVNGIEYISVIGENLIGAELGWKLRQWDFKSVAYRNLSNRLRSRIDDNALSRFALLWNKRSSIFFELRHLACRLTWRCVCCSSRSEECTISSTDAVWLFNRFVTYARSYN